jgi:hypothetical protein
MTMNPHGPSTRSISRWTAGRRSGGTYSSTLLPGRSIYSVFPWQLRRGFGDYVDISQQDRGRLIVDLKAKMGLSGPRLMALSAANRLLGPLGMHVGCVSPTITMVLQKRGEGGAGDG